MRQGESHPCRTRFRQEFPRGRPRIWRWRRHGAAPDGVKAYPHVGLFGGRGRTPGSRITTALPACSSRSAFSNIGARAGAMRPAATSAAMRNVISSSERVGVEGRHQAIVSQQGERAAAMAHIPFPSRVSEPDQAQAPAQAAAPARPLPARSTRGARAAVAIPMQPALAPAPPRGSNSRTPLSSVAARFPPRGTPPRARRRRCRRPRRERSPRRAAIP